MSDRTLLHYRLLEKIGAGGMGEVYRALDTKLGREVALKILPEAFAQNPERLARLRREAQILAALNHPNIAAIYDFQESAESCFLVMELVPGKTLAEHLARGPLAPREALSLCQQIAEALDAAHEKTIIHRDLKPANVKIAPGDRVKLLDFGLAKATEAGASAADARTLSEQLTEAGMVLGTVAYMSPEQARGLPVDKRTDIWSFGCILYEMLAGRPLFAGQTATDTLAAILRDDPKLEGLLETTPSGARLLLGRCLRRDLSHRLRDIGDALIEIEEALAAHTTAPAPPLARNVQFQRLTDFVGMKESPSITPDGRAVAFVAQAGGRRQIWIRLLDGGVPLQITRDDVDHEQPRWAPDSSSLIYYAPPARQGEQGAIWEISGLGGSPHWVGSASGGGDISHDGSRVTLFRFHDGKMELASMARDGSAIQVVKQLPGEHLYEYPRWSPDDRWIAFQRRISDVFDKGICLVPAAGGEVREIARGDDLRGLAWLPDGSGLVYASSVGGTVLYPPTFNLRSVARAGGGERQLTFGDVSYVEPDMDKSGKLVASAVRNPSDIWKFPVTGSPAENTRGGIRITRQTGQAQTPSVSPDDRELVYLSDSGGHGNLWVAKTDGSGTRQTTFERDPAVALGVPLWSPAGDQIVFILTRLGSSSQWLIRPDGSGLRQLIPRGLWACWSGDGQWLYYSITREGAHCIEKFPVDGGTPTLVRCDQAFGPAVAPDGSTLYYSVQTKGATGFDSEIRKACPENGESQMLARIPGSRVPVSPVYLNTVLSPDGKSLAVPLADGATSNLWALPADGGPMRRLTDFGDRPILIVRRVSWSPDSQHLYAAVAETDADVVLLDGLLH